MTDEAKEISFVMRDFKAEMKKLDQILSDIKKHDENPELHKFLSETREELASAQEELDNSVDEYLNSLGSSENDEKSTSDDERREGKHHDKN